MANLTRGQHPRGPLGLSRPAGRSQEGPAAGLRHALQERRRRGRGVAGAHALAADRHADRADQRLGGDDRLAGVLQLPRPLHLLRHDPAGAGDREAHRARHAQLRRLRPVRQPLPVRDLDPAQEPQQPLREHPEERGRRAGHGAQDDPAEAGDRPSTSRRTTTSSTRRRSTRRRCRTITGTSRSSPG